MGVAVYGMRGKLVAMPKGVFAEQMPEGTKPGPKFREFTPAKVVELLEKKGATKLYSQFERELSKGCGGNWVRGWNSAKVFAKVEKFKPRFHEKGLDVTFCRPSWMFVTQDRNGGPQPQRAWRHYMVGFAVDVNPCPRAHESFLRANVDASWLTVLRRLVCRGQELAARGGL